jgi:hypothetical protein
MSNFKEEKDKVIICNIKKKKTIIPYLFEKCPDLYQLIDENYDISLNPSQYIKNLIDRYITIKGHIQSGKTKFIICASTLFLYCGYSVIIILRNNKADQEQIYERLILFEKDICNLGDSPLFSICKTSFQKINIEKPRIFLTLGNGSSESKIYEELNKNKIKYFLFIDEVDYVDSGKKTKKNVIIELLKKNAQCVFGVSATIMDPIGKENIFSKDLILLSLSPYYKGIPSIKVSEIKNAKYSGKISDDLFENDKNLIEYIENFSYKKKFKFADGFVHPNICLINICRTKDPILRAQKELSKKFPKIYIIIYNGDGILLSYNNQINNYKGTISSLLQNIKDTKKNPPNIIIFSGDLAGRGISFTSLDFKWHLTSMRLLVSSSCDEPELIQKIRLCGVYNDNIPLTLYSKKNILEDIKKAYFRQEEIICNLKNNNSSILCKDIVNSLQITKDKFTKRNPVKDKLGTELVFKKVDEKCGWEFSVYENKTPVPEYSHKTLEIEQKNKEYINEFDTYIILKNDMNQKFIEINDEIVRYLETCKDNWISRGVIRKNCRQYIKDGRDLGQLQNKYSNIYKKEYETYKNYIIWRKIKREYEYKLL